MFTSIRLGCFLCGPTHIERHKSGMRAFACLSGRKYALSRAISVQLLSQLCNTHKYKYIIQIKYIQILNEIHLKSICMFIRLSQVCDISAALVTSVWLECCSISSVISTHQHANTNTNTDPYKYTQTHKYKTRIFENFFWFVICFVKGFSQVIY